MVRAETLERFAGTFGVTGFSPKAFLPSYGLAESTLAVTFAPLDKGVEVDRVDQQHYTHTANVEPVPSRMTGKSKAGGRAAPTFHLWAKPLTGHEDEGRADQNEPLTPHNTGTP